MNNITELHEGWNTAMKWTKQHKSGLFGMEISVHGEKAGRDSFYDAPRYWCSYLLGGDQCRWYRDKISEIWVDRKPVTSLVFDRGRTLFEDFDWNGGVTLFHTDTKDYHPHTGIRTWKVGDDYSHLWDSEHNRWDHYDFKSIEHRLHYVADQFYELLQKEIDPKLLKEKE